MPKKEFEENKMDYKELIEQLKEWEEYFISDACGRRDLKCEEYCTVAGKDCIIVQATTAIETLLKELEEKNKKFSEN